jgi:hypothetical protein
MKQSVLLRNPVFITERIASAMKSSPRIADYIGLCYRLFTLEHFGRICAEDEAANLAELEQSEGRVIGRYSALWGLKQDIFIIGYFSKINPYDIELNNTTILFVSEY